MQETQKDTLKWWLGPIVALVLLIGIPVIIGLTVHYVVDWETAEDRRLNITEDCREAFPNLQGAIEGQNHYNSILCLSFEEDGTIKGRILEEE